MDMPEYQQQQIETWDYINKSSLEWINYQCSKGTKDYYEMLKKYWNKDDIMFLEMDIVPNDRMVLDIAVCPKPICTYDYLIPTQRYKGYQKICANGRFGMGLTKIAKSVQKQIDIDNVIRLCNPFVINFDIVFSKIMEDKGILAHIHGIVKHNHSDLEPARWVF